MSVLYVLDVIYLFVLQMCVCFRFLHWCLHFCEIFIHVVVIGHVMAGVSSSLKCRIINARLLASSFHTCRKYICSNQRLFL